MNTSETLIFNPLLLSGTSSIIIFEILNRLKVLKNKSSDLSDQIVMVLLMCTILMELNCWQDYEHCVKSAGIWSFSGPHFSAFGLITEIYRVNLSIQSECGKMRTRKTSNTNTYAVKLISANTNLDKIFKTPWTYFATAVGILKQLSTFPFPQITQIKENLLRKLITNFLFEPKWRNSNWTFPFWIKWSQWQGEYIDNFKTLSSKRYSWKL